MKKINWQKSAVYNGFSLAEALITLLVVCVITIASVPVITKNIALNLIFRTGFMRAIGTGIILQQNIQSTAKIRTEKQYMILKKAATPVNSTRRRVLKTLSPQQLAAEAEAPAQVRLFHHHQKSIQNPAIIHIPLLTQACIKCLQQAAEAAAVMLTLHTELVPLQQAVWHMYLLFFLQRI